jgi:Bacterial pre-peptidase C-terminal domain
VSGIPAHAQGNGIVDVNKAWSMLRSGPLTRAYTSSVRVCSALSGSLPTPDRGVGIYNDCPATGGGHRPGQVKSYTVTVTRTSGPAAAIVHTVTWVGNDGTFGSPSRVTLPLNKPVAIAVTAEPAAGAHSAIMRIDDPATTGVDFETLNTVIASTELRTPGYRFDTEGAVDRNATRSFFVSVPAGTRALQVNLSGIATGSQTRWLAYAPGGVPVDSTATKDCYPNYSDASVCNPTSRAYTNPKPGVWELTVESRRTSASLANPYTLAAQLQGVAVEPAQITLASATIGGTTPLTWHVTDTFAPVVVRGMGGPLSSVRTLRPRISQGDSQKFTLDVPAGSSALTVTIGGPSDLAADLDLYIRRNGVEVGSSADGDAEESVTLTRPVAGTYEVEVDGYSVPAGSTTYDYVDAYTSPLLGTLSSSTAPLTLANRGHGTLAGSVMVRAQPGQGRTLAGELDVVSAEGAILGRGLVGIGSVN